jgi:serine/threonine-protein kinase RsbT
MFTLVVDTPHAKPNHFLSGVSRLERLVSMNDFERVTRILERHLSPIHARSVLRHALSEHNVRTATFTLADLAKINGSLTRGLRLFATELASNRALQDIEALTNSRKVEIQPCAVDILAELDITSARSAARRMCEQAGASGFVTQKVTTIVSELARNIVSYTPGGKVELAWKPDPRPRIVIRAIDHGPGISNLSHVLSGNYQSRTGLGRGLTGTRRLAEHFDITTGASGTTIVVEVAL